MRVCVFGAGGIGGYLAVRLASAGHEASVVARGDHLAAIRARGLVFEAPSGAMTAQVPASDDPAELGEQELVIFAVKCHQLEDAIARAGPLMGERGVALPILNGVAAPGMLEAAFGEGRALIGVARVSAEIVAPGVIGRLESEHGITVGDRAGRQTTEPAASIRAAFREAGIPSPESRDVRGDLWSKLVTWNGGGTLSAAARCDFGTIRGTPELRRLYRRLVEEALEVALAEGAPVSRDLPDRAMEALDRMHPGIRSSMAADLEAGRPLELDFLTGAVARMGRARGVPVPATEAMAAALAPWRDGA